MQWISVPIVTVSLGVTLLNTRIAPRSSLLSREDCLEIFFFCNFSLFEIFAEEGRFLCVASSSSFTLNQSSRLKNDFEVPREISNIPGKLRSKNARVCPYIMFNIAAFLSLPLPVFSIFFPLLYKVVQI